MKDKIYIVEWYDPTNYEDEELGLGLTHRVTVGKIREIGDLVYVIHGWDEDSFDYLVVHKNLIINKKQI